MLSTACLQDPFFLHHPNLALRHHGNHQVCSGVASVLPRYHDFHPSSFYSQISRTLNTGGFVTDIHGLCCSHQSSLPSTHTCEIGYGEPSFAHPSTPVLKREHMVPNLWQLVVLFRIAECNVGALQERATQSSQQRYC